MPSIATNTRVSREELLDFARERHRYALVTTRQDGRPQVSPVTGGVDPEGRLVRSDGFLGRWAPIGIATGVSRRLADPVAHAPASAEPPQPPRSPRSEQARPARSDKSLVRITVESWGPVATGGFPARSSDDA